MGSAFNLADAAGASWWNLPFTLTTLLIKQVGNMNTTGRSQTRVPMIVIIAGLPGTGKSTLARALAQRLPGAVLDKDSIRASLFQPPYVEYSRLQDDFCQEIMLQTAAYLLSKHAQLKVLLDGRPFSRQYHRDRVTGFCSQVGTPWATLECVCSEATAMSRIAEGVAANSHLAANRTPELYREIREAWEPIDQPKLVIDTDEDIETCVNRALRYLTGSLNG